MITEKGIFTMENKEIINENELENVNGGYAVVSYSFNKGDKFVDEQGRYLYVGNNYPSIAPSSFVFFVREDTTAQKYQRINGQAAIFQDYQYLGIDLEGYERVAKVAR